MHFQLLAALFIGVCVGAFGTLILALLIIALQPRPKPWQPDELELPEAEVVEDCEEVADNCSDGDEWKHGKKPFGDAW